MERGTKAFVQVGCNGGAGIGIALRGGVAEEIVIVFGIEQLLDGLMNGGRSRDVWISDTEIKDIFGADLGSAFFTVFENLADYRFFVPRVTIFLKSCVNPPEVNCLPLF